MSKELKKNIQLKFGRPIRLQRDLIDLKEDIYFVTGEILGFNTLRRFYGFLKHVEPQRKTLNILSNYVGFRTYNKFLNKDKIDLLWKSWNYLNKFLKQNNYVESDFNWLIELKSKDYYYLLMSRIISEFFVVKSYRNLDILFSCQKLFSINKREVTAKITTTLNNELLNLSNNELQKLHFLLKNQTFREIALYGWVEMDNAKSYHGSLIFNSKKYIENEDEALFTNLYFLLLNFLDNKTVIFPSKLTLPENCHPILLGRYWSIQMICFRNDREYILNKILSIAKEIDSKNEFFQEIIPVLMLLKNVSAIEKILENYYEELIDYFDWDHISIERYNLMALALVYIKKENYLSLDQLFDSFNVDEEFHFNNNYQKLFYSIALYHFRKQSSEKEILIDQAEDMYNYYAKKLGFKYFDEDFLITYLK